MPVLLDRSTFGLPSFRGQGGKVNIWLGGEPDGMGPVWDDNAAAIGSIPGNGSSQDL